MVKLCPKCGATLTEVIGGYLCNECGGGMFYDEDVIIPQCPSCGDELGILGDEYYCFRCPCSVSKNDVQFSCEKNPDEDYDFEDPDYDSMVNNGEEICLNCTFWSVSPYGSANGMYCRKGNGQTDPDDTCFEFVQSSHFANYGDAGQYQFDETGREISNKLYYWRNSR